MITNHRFIAAGLSIGLLLIASPELHAGKMATQTLHPASAQESGFTVKAKRQEDGQIEFTVDRDLSKARSFPPDSGLKTRRTAILKITRNSDPVVSCELAPTTRGQIVTYRFTVSEECLPDSYLTILENDDYQDESEEHLIGGGSSYRIDLAEFAKPQ